MSSRTETRDGRHVAVRERRRWPRRLGLVVIVLVLVFYGGGGWYFADQLRADGLAVDPYEREYRAEVVELGTGSVTLAAGSPADADAFADGFMGLFWEGGYGDGGRDHRSIREHPHTFRGEDRDHRHPAI